MSLDWLKRDDEIKNHQEFKTVSLGEYELKNVKQPIEVYAIYQHSPG